MSAAPAGYIALVEDDDSLRRATARLLAAYSFEVCAYASAREFLDSLELSQPVCLILDLQMNDMTGLELLHYLARTDFRFPTIVTTAHDEPGTRHRCGLAGASGFLLKPLHGDALQETIKRALAGSSAERNARGPREVTR
jgi:FixJ family two-component response regulator